MRITVDTSVIVAAVAEESSKAKILNATKGAELIAPNSVHWEFGNAVSSLYRRGRISNAMLKDVIRAYERIPIQFADISLEHALDIVADERIYAYDAFIIACSQKYRTPLITLDKQLEVVAQRQGVDIVEL